MNKRLLIVLNVCIMILGIVFAARYSSHLQGERTALTRDSFATTVASMEQLSLEYLRTQQEYADNWCQYINGKEYTLDEAVEFLGELNSSSEISAQIIDPDTGLGVSTKAYVLDEENYAVDYSTWDEREGFAQILENADREDYLNITDTFTNPIDASSVVGFGGRVSLVQEDGQRKDYLLLRLVPLKTLREKWIFPVGYEEAEIGIIDANGDYIIRSEEMKSENFLEFIRAYNDLTYPQKDALQEEMSDAGSGILEYRDARGQDAYWVYSTLAEVNGWYLIGYVPVDSLETYGVDWPIILIVCGVMLLLMFVDGAYFVIINSRLRESMKEAEQANEAKTRFLSSMSHDIRTPMNAIMGMTSIATRHLDDRERIADCLKKITMASSHLLTLINDILDISRVESGQFVLNPLVFSLPDLITNLANIVRTQIGAKSLDFRAHIADIKYEYLYADELRLSQIFINILSNAVKYTPPGGRITLTLREAKLDETDKTVRLIYSVADTGIGMNPDFMKTIFEPFTRERDSRIDTIEGSGLGLAITKQMVDAMNGTIEVQSEPGKGSTFTVALDLPVAEKMTDDLMLPPVRMLIADDDEICLETTADLLETMGVSADLADGGEKAVSMAKAEHEKGTDYPIIMLDWKMPDVDGVAAARRIRQQVGDEVSIVILSAFDWSEIEEEARAAGVNAFISKPTFRSSMYELLSGFLEPEKKEKEAAADVEEDFAGMHLLVAEDNDMNWEIIRELLGFHGITADRAENGAVCVKKISECPEGRYRAILMDIQMPVMNGREAAREIRRLPRTYARDIPIIAMTADAFAEDVRACLDAGMNGHVAKPVDMKQLLAELKKIEGYRGEKKQKA